MENNKRMASGDNPRSEEETQRRPLSDNRNPMLNDVVLARLFQLCDASDLLRFRLVSKKWHALAADSFRRDVPVTFESPSTTYGPLRFKSFFELDPGKTPFGNYRMKEMDIGQLPVDSETPFPVEFLTFRQSLEHFWGRYGSFIRKLELLNPVIHSVEAFKKMILEETPNLEELILFDLQYKTGSRSRSGNFDGGNVGRMQLKLKRLVVNPLCCLPVGWDLLRHFPNIQNVEVTPRQQDTIDIDNGSVLGYLRAISEQLSRRRRPCRITVHELKFNIRSQAQATISKTILQIPQLALPKLHLIMEFRDRNCEEDLLSTAFRHHGENLEDLYVYIPRSWPRQSPYDNFPFKLGPFNSTTSIRLTGNLSENLHFLKHFPNMEILQMGDFGLDLLAKTESTIMETFTLQALKVFQLNMCISYITKDQMEMLVKVMPAVETFHGRLINESFRVLCREWKQLKVLSFETSSQSPLWVNDEGITGIICGSEERLPNITDLKALKSLSVENAEGLGDASIWNGFLEIPNLRNLSARISPGVSDDAYGALTEKFDYCDISRNSDYERMP